MARPIRGRADYLDVGDWNAVCFECDRKRKASTLRKHWQGYWVCPEHWEARHPQDFVRSVPDNITPPFQQPPEDTFVSLCSWQGRMALSDIGTADCMIADFVAPGWAERGLDPAESNSLGEFILGTSTLS